MGSLEEQAYYAVLKALGATNRINFVSSQRGLLHVVPLAHAACCIRCLQFLLSSHFGCFRFTKFCTTYTPWSTLPHVDVAPRRPSCHHQLLPQRSCCQPLLPPPDAPPRQHARRTPICCSQSCAQSWA